MIRNTTEYEQAKARLAEESTRLAADRARLNESGIEAADIEQFLEPLESLLAQLKEDTGEFERSQTRVSETATSPVEVPLDDSPATDPTNSQPAASKSKIIRKSKAKRSKRRQALPKSKPSTTQKTKGRVSLMPRRKGKTFGPVGKKAKLTRRKFSLEDKARILAEIDAAPRGTKGTVVERHGLHSAMIAEWRKRVARPTKTAAGSKVGQSVAKRGRPRSVGVSAGSSAFGSADFIDIVKENSALRAEVAALRSSKEQVKRFVAIQRQLASEMLGVQ